MSHRFLSTPQDVADFANLLGNLKLPVTVQWKQGRDRSLDQNALQFVWALEAAQQLGQSLNEIRNEWKLRHGVPILRSEDEAFRSAYDEAIKPHPYAMKLRLMEYFPVTRLMSVKQMTQYLDTIQRECLQAGLRLTDPEARK